MDRRACDLIEQLKAEHNLTEGELLELLTVLEEERLTDGRGELAVLLAEHADTVRRQYYGNKVYVRGLIEISNYCKNDCYYCGIRRSNEECERYRLTPDEILECCRQGYELGFRTFVLQGGEDWNFNDATLCDIVGQIKACHPDCAVTLSLGERSEESYAALKATGADRYLLRHETATKAHYEMLHPPAMSFENRMECLQTLKRLGYQTGCGIMVGSPGQTLDDIVRDLEFIRGFQPDMCGIGPFIPHHATPFGGQPAGTLEQTVYLQSMIRLLVPDILLPATTALGTIHPQGRELGIRAGANVVMPNLSPLGVRKKYELYNNKISTGQESAQCLADLKQRMEAIGYEVVVGRGDVNRPAAEPGTEGTGKPGRSTGR